MMQVNSLTLKRVLDLPSFLRVFSNQGRLFFISLLMLTLGCVAINMEPLTVSAPSQVQLALPQTDSLITVTNHSFLQTLPAETKQKVNLNRAGLTQPEIEQLSSYLSRKYKIADTAATTLIQGALHAAKEQKIDPFLILAVIAVESSFNPFAQSTMGAQGLMQVMTKVHEDKFERFGGASQALHPVANIRVGAEILAEYVQRGGSVQEGLKMYVGASGTSDGGYSAKVLAERGRLVFASQGKLEMAAPVNLGLDSATFSAINPAQSGKEPVLVPASLKTPSPEQTSTLVPTAELPLQQNNAATEIHKEQLVQI